MSSTASAIGAYGRLLGLLALAAVLTLRALDPWPVQAMRLRLFDLLQDLSPRKQIEQPVVIVEIDEASLAAHGQWPWPRALLGDLVDAIVAGAPKAIAFDVLFVEPDRLSPEQIGQSLAAAMGTTDPAIAKAVAALPANDAILAESFKGAPVVLGVAAGRSGGSATPPRDSAARSTTILERGAAVADHLRQFGAFNDNIPILDAAAAGRGVVSLDLGADGVLRRLPALSRAGDRALPALGFELIRAGDGADFMTAEAGAAGLEAVSVADVTAATDANGEVWLHYAGHRPERFVRASAVLSGEASPETFAGKYVLIGATAAGLGDIVATPLGYAMAGVEVHAELVEGLLAGETLTRPALLSAAEIAVIGVIGLLIIFVRPGGRAVRLTLMLLAPAVLLAATSWALFHWADMLFDPVYPAMAAAAVLTVVVSAGFVAGERRQRLLAEQAAIVERDARARIELLLESTGEAIYGIDLDGRCTFFNGATSTLLGLPDDFDPIGRNMHDLSHYADADGEPLAEADCPVHTAYREGRSAESVDDVVWRHDGAAVAVEQRAFPVRKAGDVVGGVVIVIDVSERKAAAEAIAEREARLRNLQGEIDKLSQMGVLSQVSSFLAHELNQPLAAVMNYIPASRRILAGGADDAPAKSRDYLEKALQQARRAADIVKGLREMSAKGEAQRAPDDLARIVEEAVEITRMEHSRRPVRIGLEIERGLPRASVSAIQIQQIVINLVRNAVEAIGEDAPGAVDVEVRATLDGAGIEVSVSDDGPGLPDAAQDLFKPFVTSKATGMGVGLAICERIIQAHGGEISAGDHPDGGAVFRFSLPAVAPADQDRVSA